MVNNPRKQQLDDETKLKTVVRILSGEITAQKVASELGVQSYQLHAWIGYICVKRPDVAYEALEKRFHREQGDTGVLAVAGADPSETNDTLETKVMEAYLRKLFIRRPRIS